MKKKYRGFLSVGSILMALALTAVYAIGGSDKTDGGFGPGPPKRLPAMTAPNPEALKEMSQLEVLLDSLVTSPQSVANPVDLSAFGYEPSDPSTLDTTFSDSVPSVRMDYKLTFAFSSNSKKFCIID